MNIGQLLCLPKEFEITDIEMVDDRLTISVISKQNQIYCPLCSYPAWRVHSHYTRTVADLSCAGQPVRLLLSVRKFFCKTALCPRKVFVERLSPFIEPWARVTTRLYQNVQIIGLATSGKLGARVAEHLGIPTSWKTILRRIMTLSTTPVEQVVELGIDDFSFRRGRKFGSILVDMQSHKVIDLLPDRTAETTKSWMQAHPEIELVSRDRSGDYAAGARAGAPQAIQVADRFHLYKNLVEATERVLVRCRAEIRKNAQASMSPMTAEMSKRLVQKTEFLGVEEWKPALDPYVIRKKLARREAREDRYQQVLDLINQGFSHADIISRVGISHDTLRRWLKQGGCALKDHQKRRNRFDDYAAYVLSRWNAGQHNGTVLWKEIQELGYTGSLRMVYRFLIPLRRSQRVIQKGDMPAVPLQDFSPRDAVWLFAYDPAALDQKEREKLNTICNASETASKTYELVQEFRYLLHNLEGEKLDDWIAKVKNSQISELRGFVLGVERDKAAVVAGLTLPQNNGLVEGLVNKLKLIKRMMFGRASFALLRQRVIHAL